MKDTHRQRSAPMTWDEKKSRARAREIDRKHPPEHRTYNWGVAAGVNVGPRKR